MRREKGKWRFFFLSSVDIGHEVFLIVDKNGPHFKFYAAYTKDAKFFMARKFMLQPLRRYNIILRLTRRTGGVRKRSPVFFMPSHTHTCKKCPVLNTY